MTIKKTEVPRFSAAIGGMLSALGVVADELTISGYRMALADLPIEAIEAGAVAVARTSKGFPVPADVLRAAGQRSPAELAADAWEIAAKLARNIRDAHHPDPVAEAAVKKLGGWRAIGMASEERLVWIRKEFLELYQDGSTGEPVREMLAEGEKTQISERAEAVASKLAGKMTL